MDSFNYKNGSLFCESVNVDKLVDQVGSPAYIYSAETFRNHYTALRDAFAEVDPIICYSIKSCGNLHIIKLLDSLGCGMDTVSGGEVFRAKQAGADMSKIVYAGVGKTDAEITLGINEGIGWFNIESEEEFENIARIAETLGKQAHGALRVNPDIYDPKTHVKTNTGKKETKFGVDIERAKQFFRSYGKNQHCRLDAIHLHIGSPIYSPDPYVMAIEKALVLIDELRAEGFEVNTLDIGGGYAADYETGKSPSYKTYADAIVPLIKGKDLKIIIEPGRTISGNSGILVGDVQYIKQGGNKKFAILNTGMHHLLRPAMYEAFHFVWPTAVAPEHMVTARTDNMDLPNLEKFDVVGPICESSDTIAKERMIPAVKRGDRIAIFTAGAYGMVMASNYNAMPRPVEVLVDGTDATIIRKRETYNDVVALERDTEQVLL
ncbi:Diaminopimelate decarboxylase [Poriferisphaera corsica]|uniref:Diaminopimelate decarboxylase n=1 Tax=Poriferisphaera corsica TaxID=2528020 RepID=A0A517YXR8_9BACT|nr:diaminopimelate decarboxylase [Poriferisphaera corsica]QDU35011.1 Diaminopimelate decarboxylase [Poriferisphaera corsica]